MWGRPQWCGVYRSQTHSLTHSYTQLYILVHIMRWWHKVRGNTIRANAIIPFFCPGVINDNGTVQELLCHTVQQSLFVEGHMLRIGMAVFCFELKTGLLPPFSHKVDRSGWNLTAICCCVESYGSSGLDWPLCHCAVAQAPPSTNTGAPGPFEILWRVRYGEKLYYRCGPLPTPLVVMITKLSLIGIPSKSSISLWLVAIKC